MTLRTVSAFETEGNHPPFRVTAPTRLQFERMHDRLTHGEVAFCEKYPELATDYNFAEFFSSHPEICGVTSFYLQDIDDLPGVTMNVVNELLAGPKKSIRDYIEMIEKEELWHEGDHRWLRKVRINLDGCWEMPKYLDLIEPDRARYPQPNVYSKKHGKIMKQQGAAWMWDRVIGEIPSDELPSGKRAFWTNHRCNNKACVYPRHVALGRPEANDAFTNRMESMAEYEKWTSNLWARPSFGYPEGLGDIVHESEVEVLSDRAVILPVRMSRREFDACVNVLSKANHLPDGGWTTDPGYHVLFGALKRGVDFDKVTGCWNARIDLDTMSPHKKTVTHACGNTQCCNIRHMDIADSHKKYYLVQENSYVTLPDGQIVNTETGELLPPYWESWDLYWNCLKKYSGSPSLEHEIELANEPDFEPILTETDFAHIWVHPLTGCWENTRFYPRWLPNGAQQSAYGYNGQKKPILGKNAHRLLLYKHFEYIGDPQAIDEGLDADHKCNNRRCCNPLHMQFTERKAHMQMTRDRAKLVTAAAAEISKIVGQRIMLRNLGGRVKMHKLGKRL